MAEKKNTGDLTGPDDSTGSFNRRRFLKSLGVAGSTAIFGITGASTVQGSSASKADKQRVLAARPVQLLLDELDSPTVTEVTKQKQSLQDWTMTVITLGTEFGQLVYGEPDDGKATAMFKFDLEQVAAAPPREVPQRYQSIPSNGNAILTLDKQAGPVFMRTATETEQQQLVEKTGANPNDTLMFYNSLIDGFEVVPTGQKKDNNTQDKHQAAYLVKPQTDSRITPTSRGINVEQTTIDSMETEIVATAGCVEWIGVCGTTIAWCGGCIMACASIPLTTFAGVAACATCVISSCAVSVPVACYKMLDNCS